MSRGNAVRSAFRRPRRDPNVGDPVHQPCRQCGRLLAPINGNTPPHRKPKHAGDARPRDYIPLTGADAPWCTE